MLKIFVIEGDGSYASGMVVVAATNNHEASVLANKGSSTIWKIVYECSDAVEINYMTLSKEVTEPKVLLRHEYGE